MSPTPVEEARRAIELSANAVVSTCHPQGDGAEASGTRVLEAVHRFVQMVNGNVHLNRARMDCLAEYQRQRSAAVRRKVTLVAELRALREAVQAEFPATVASETPSDVPSIENHYSFARFDRFVQVALEERSEVDEGDVIEDSANGETPADILWVILDQRFPARGVAPDDERLMDFRDRVAGLRDELRRALRAQSLLDQVHPATKWRWLSRIVKDSNPSTDTVEWLVPHAGDREPYRSYFRYLYDPGAVSTEDREWLERFRPEVSATVVAIRAEFETRLGARASLAWALRRYARRCRWLRLAELRGGAVVLNAGQRRQREVLLTRDAGVFLFDQGFEVLIEQAHGQHRYDILAPSLLVEAKVYSKKRRPLDAVVAGIKQIHQYATALASEGPTPEPILILFRLDGPVADPLEEYTIGNLRVSIVWVDLGPAQESGSHARAPDLSVTNEAIDRKLDGRGKRRTSRR